MLNYLTLIFVSLILIISLCNCGKGDISPIEQELRKSSIQYDGYTRTFSYYAPYALTGSPSLVIVLHKSKSNGAELRGMMEFRYEQLADQKQFVVLYPDGYEGCWNDCRRAPGDSAHKNNINDTGFIEKLIGIFIEKYSINPAKIYVAGMSGGGHMALRLVKELPGKITAIAPMLAQLPEKNNSKCGTIEPPVPVPVFFLSGTKDPVSPYEGGEVSLFGLFLRQGEVLSVKETVNQFLQINGITTSPVVNIVKPEFNSKKMWIEKRIWKELGRPAIWHYIVHGGGHTLPGVKPLPKLFFGKTCASKNIADDIIEFFMMHDLSQAQ